MINVEDRIKELAIAICPAGNPPCLYHLNMAKKKIEGIKPKEANAKNSGNILPPKI